MSWIEDHYGGRRQLLRHWAALYHIRTGGWWAERAISWKDVSRLVFICAGNICRSPYGEARARQLGLSATSGGLTAVEGAPANSSALRNARPRGIDLVAHRSRPFVDLPLMRGDLLAIFEPAHLTAVASRAQAVGAQVTLLGLWAVPHRPYVADPYGKNDRYFQKCFALIDSALDRVRQHVN